MKRILFQVVLIISLFIITSYSQTAKSQLSKITTNDNYEFISVNEIYMWVSNNGDGSHSPLTDGNGFYWPGGINATKSSIFEDGLVWGGIVNGQIRVNGNTHRQGLQAGKILPNGSPDDPSLPKYRVYKILKGWENLPPGPIRDEYELDYNEWPVEDGAPWVDVNGDGVYTPGVDKPKYVGDETLWYVANDMDPARSTFTYGSLPIGLEFQTTIWAFDSTNFLGDVVFKKYKIINKSDTAITDMYISYWTDVDLGDANDDYVGFDTTLQLGFQYNSDNADGDGTGSTYGTPPPAVGHMFVQFPVVPSSQSDSAFFNGTWYRGLRSLRMNATGMNMKNMSQYPNDATQGNYSGTLQWYNLFQGLHNSGFELIDPTTNNPTRFPLSGDPINQTGWYEGEGWPGGPAAGDRRFHIPTGSFNMAPGDTQEVVIAIFMALGTDNFNSVAVLKQKAQQIQNFYGAFVPNIVGVDDDIAASPDEFMLMQNYPNPFNPTTKISFTIPSVTLRQAQSDISVALKVYDVLGNEVATLVNEERPAGSYEVEFDASGLSSGVYFYKLQAGQFVQTRKMLMIK